MGDKSRCCHLNPVHTHTSTQINASHTHPTTHLYITHTLTNNTQQVRLAAAEASAVAAKSSVVEASTRASRAEERLGVVQGQLEEQTVAAAEAQVRKGCVAAAVWGTLSGHDLLLPQTHLNTRHFPWSLPEQSTPPWLRVFAPPWPQNTHNKLPTHTHIIMLVCIHHPNTHHMPHTTSRRSSVSCVRT